MRTCLAIAFTFLWIVPTFVHADVLINEVAWMGTASNANDEWIELYNDGTEQVSLDGWTLQDGVSLTIPLSGSIDAESVILLERSDDDTVPGVLAFLIYTGALANDGRTLSLKRSDGTTEDSVVGGESWSTIGGDNATKNTPQRTASGWVTSTPTPGEQNVAEEETNQTESSSTNTTSSSHTSGTASKGVSGSQSKVTKPQPPPSVLTLGITAPKTVSVNQEVFFEAVPTGVGPTIERSLTYTWNFGDTYTGTLKKASHTFTYPGEYIVVLEGAYAKQYATARHEIRVLPVSFLLEETTQGDVRLHNEATYEVDIGGFSLVGKHTFTFPKFTFLKGKGSLIIPKGKIGSVVGVKLYDGVNTQVATLPIVSNVPISKITAVPKVENSAKEVVARPEPAQEVSTIEPEQTIIQIGSAHLVEEPKDVGVLRSFFQRISRYFGS